MDTSLKIAVVYDWIDKWGGVERVLLVLHDLFPDAHFYTSYRNTEASVWANGLTIKTSFIQKLPSVIRNNRIASIPWYPFAFESFNFNAYDAVISVTSSFAKSIITSPHTKHFCYLLTPTRFLWSHENEYIQNRIDKFFISPYTAYLRRWDTITANRPDYMISISECVKKRCLRYYHRDSDVIYPPFDTDYWTKINTELSATSEKKPSLFDLMKQIKNRDYYLIVSRLEKYKKIDMAIEVFNKNHDKNLVIVGTGTQKRSLKSIANDNIHFLSDVSDDELGILYSRAKALIMPQNEDFGYVSLEAQFFGCPVIAYAEGGASETIIDNKSGLLFKVQSAKSLSHTLEQFHIMSYNLKSYINEIGVKNIKRFDKMNFKKKFQTLLISKCQSPIGKSYLKK